MENPEPTVNGSEIRGLPPGMCKTWLNKLPTTNLNRLAEFQPSTVSWASNICFLQHRFRTSSQW